MRLFARFIVRQLVRERLRTSVTVLGVALGIAVILAIRMANASALRGFEGAVEAIAGRASLEIRSAGPLDETRLPGLSWLGLYGEWSAVIEGNSRYVADSGAVETLRVLGIDILRDRPLRDYRLHLSKAVSRQPSPDQFLELLMDPRSVILTTRFASQQGLSVGHRIVLAIGDRRETFTVRGLLEDVGPARALEGRFALMDIAAAQLAFGMLGHVNRVEVRLHDPRSIEAAEREIAARLPEGLTVQRPSGRGRTLEKMVAAFHFNLTALSWVALLVGLFLIYNTVSVSVISRRSEIGTLRALGCARSAVTALFLGEALLLAAAGCAIGVPIAGWLARAAVSLTSTTIHVFYGELVSAPPAARMADVVLAAAIALPLTLVAAAMPALEASRVPPADAMRSADRLETRYRLSASQLAGPTLLLALGGWLATLPPASGLPVAGFLSALALALGGAWLTPAVLFCLVRAGARPIRWLLGVEGRLAHANLAGSIPRLSISVAALSMSLSMTVAIAVMVGSFRETVAHWVGQTLQGDLFVSPAGGARGGTDATISPDVESVISALPEVSAVDPFRRLDVPYAGSAVFVGAGSFRAVIERGNLAFKSPADGKAAMERAIGQDAVVISEPFALKHGKAVGDDLTLPTRAGMKTFEVAAVYYDYSSDRGIAVLDAAAFERHYGNLRPSSLTLYLRPGADAERVRRSILDGLGPRHQVLLHTNAALRGEVMRIFDSTFAITYALEAIAIFVAMLGVAATLVTLVIERRHDLAILRLIGTARRQVRRMVMIEAGLLGAASQAIGLGVGLVLSLVLIFVINVQSFGWTIRFHLPVAFLLQMSVLMMVATVLSGIYPARRACELPAAEEVVEE